jgi:hypothetical protein
VSARVGRLLRAEMRDAARESPERVRQRIAMRKAGELAVKAREEKYPTLTPENAGEAMAYQEERLRAEQARLLEERNT